MKSYKPKELTTEEKIKQMKEQKCCYPELDGETEKICGKRQMMTISLSLIAKGETGIVQHESIAMGLPFCDYHSFVIMSGQFGIMTDRGQPKYLEGPFDIVRIVESVIYAQQMSGKFTKTEEAIKNGKREAEKFKKEMEAHKDEKLPK